MSSLINSVLGALTGGQGAQGDQNGAAGGLSGLAKIAMQNPQLLQVVASMFTAGNKHGGLSGMLQKFEQAGLSNQAQSWVSEGENQAVAPSQIEQVFGHDGIERIAQKAGVSPTETPDLLSQILPALISGLTPAGRAPAQTPNSADDLMGMLGGLLGKR